MVTGLVLHEFIMSYSQYGEDRIIRGLLGDETGRLLDIGAWDPKAMSNSRCLIEAGWEAVLVEPSPIPLSNLIREYADHPKVIVVGAAIGRKRGLESFSFTDDATTTSDEETRCKWGPICKYYGDAYVNVMTITELVSTFGDKFEFVNIDAEGNSCDIARHMLAKTGIRPSVLCIEHDGHVEMLTEQFSEHGYRLVTDNGTNVIFAK